MMYNWNISIDILFHLLFADFDCFIVLNAYYKEYGINNLERNSCGTVSRSI